MLVLVLDFVVEALAALAISTWVWEMYSRMPPTRRLISFMVILLGFMCLGFDGLLAPLLTPPPFIVLPFACGLPPSSVCELLLGASEDLRLLSLGIGGSRSLVYWFLPTRLLRIGGRPVFLCELLEGGWSGKVGAGKEVAADLLTRVLGAREAGSGVADRDSAGEKA